MTVDAAAYAHDVPVTCRPAEVGDLASWMALVAEVEDLFGPMLGFEQHATRAIERGTAFVVTDEQEVLGAVLLSPDGKPHHIRWLAVREVARRSGVGSRLVAAILCRWPTGDIGVVTFAASSASGMPARRFYERFGFESEGATHPARDGSERDLFVLRRPSGP